MDSRSRSDVVEDEPVRKMGVLGGRRCADCRMIVHWRVEKFCLEKRQRFAGRIYCMGCQKAYPEIPRGISA